MSTRFQKCNCYRTPEGVFKKEDLEGLSLEKLQSFMRKERFIYEGVTKERIISVLLCLGDTMTVE